MGRRVRRRAQLQLEVKQGHQREELRQLLVGAGPEVVDHAGSAGTSRPLAEDSEAEVAVVALLDRGLQGAPAGEGLWRGLGLGLWRSLGHGHGLSGSLPSASLSLPSLSLSSPSSSRGALLTGEPIVAM